jgi:hypothetical protein
MPVETSPDDATILSELIERLAPLPPESRAHLLNVVATFFKVGGGSEPSQVPPPERYLDSLRFSDHADLSPKQFLIEKQPGTDIERVACLAFYLTHYRSTPHFKTLDISKLNTEAAQVKFSNPAFAVDNATKRGFLVPAIKGMKQLGVLGERFVNALPDREKARALSERKHSRKAKRKLKSDDSLALA